MKNNINNENNLSFREKDSEELEMKVLTSEKLSDKHKEFLKNSRLKGISITDNSLDVIDSGFDEDLIINILKTPELVEDFESIKDLDVNVIKAMVAEGGVEVSSMNLDDDSLEAANTKLNDLNKAQLDNKRMQEDE